MTAWPDEQDITARKHGGDPNSAEAHKSIKKDKSQTHQAILNYLARRPITGATCEEIELALTLSHQTCSARISELRANQRIISVGDRRTTSSGRWARVHRIPPQDTQ